MGDLEPLGVNIGPIYAQNLSLKNFTVTQKIYSYSKKITVTQFTVTENFLQLLKKSTVTPDKYPKVILIHR